MELPSKHPGVRALIRATFPDYRRRTVEVRPAEKVSLYGLNWEGGSRYEYRTCTLEGQLSGSADKYNQRAPWDNPAEGASVPIPPGFACVRGGYFCGKVSRLQITINPADMPRLLAGA